MSVTEALKIVQEQLKPYIDKQTEDGPCIIIRPNNCEVIDCYGGIIFQGNIEDCYLYLDALN